MEHNDIFNNINSMIDFTLLDPRATNADLEKLCDIAYKNGYYSVCVNPCNVKFVKSYITQHLFSSVKVVTVIGFPLGANTTNVKELEVKQALYDGADEFDVVINIGRAKNFDYEFITKELKQIKKIVKKHIVKAIIETCYFDYNEIIKLCNCVLKSKVDYVKTSTGFGTAGADFEVLKIVKQSVGNKCKIKASGGIRLREQVIKFIELGADRIGTSHII